MTPQNKGKFLFRFALVADSHLNPVDAANTSPWQTNHMANQRNEVVVDAINQLEPAFTIHVGDVVHPLPTTPHYEGASAYALQLYSRLTKPFFIAPGNHDIGDKWQAGTPAASISNQTCEEYETRFGLQWQAFEHNDCCFIILNACLLGSGLPQERVQWLFLEDMLAKNKSKRKFVFSHYPPYITDPAEPDNYDNIDSAPRARLLKLLEDHDVEALFAGHVHTFFLNRFGTTWSYALPSSTNFRQDYAELFKVEPAQELGRNDLGKFGFFIVDVHESGHVARFVRTHGSTSADDVNGIVAQVGTDVRNDYRPTVGVAFTHDWTSSTRLPFNPPLDTFMRKEARNDYFILNLWDCAIRTVRIPAHDVLEATARNRVRILAALGHRFTIFNVNAPSDALLEALQALGNSVQGLELICTREQMGAPLPEMLCKASYPVFYAPIFSVSDKLDAAAPFDHTMASGITMADMCRLLDDEGMQARLGQHAGIVVRIGYSEPVLESLEQIAGFSRSNTIPVMVHVKLSPDESYVLNADDHSQAARVAEASIGAALYPDMAISLDTFMDVDRGYFTRQGLVDRRHNPRQAGGAARDIHQHLQGRAGLRIQAIERLEHATRIVLESEEGPLELSVRSSAANPWNPLHPAVEVEVEHHHPIGA
ncbi:metallophosphoesterase family protein [Allopusillimonas ginsengisoli]|uniref:metallophosphoesterase family protein n=1 Tax=Allopusillimonas ginsengisoli TaxID=453575 RepID=UPI001431994A|nr:metallophosphoesterase [Allopusillimonas ginsengisoli]